MSKPVITILPSKTVLDAARIMTDKNIESLVVVWGDRAVGIITEKDIVRRVVSKELPYTTKVLDVMSKPVTTISADEFLGDAREIMIEHGIKRLPVTEKGKIIGIVVESDLIK